MCGISTIQFLAVLPFLEAKSVICLYRFDSEIWLNRFENVRGPYSINGDTE
jgi:hypothetical protein